MSERSEKIRQMHLDGMSIKAIARKLGMAPSSVRRHLAKQQWPIRVKPFLCRCGSVTKFAGPNNVCWACHLKSTMMGGRYQENHNGG